MRPRPLLILPLILLATPVHAARTATISGAPTAHASPDAASPVTHRPPSGATVTVDHCTSDAAPAATRASGAQNSALDNNDWCLLRGVGWVRGESLVNLSADPALLPDDSSFDPLKSTAPTWDKLDDAPDDTPPPPSF